MTVFINELSLDGQFENLTEFKDNLNSINFICRQFLKFNEDIKLSDALYNCPVVENILFSTLLVQARQDELTVFKQLLTKAKFWNYETFLHSSEDEYICSYTSQKTGYSLAEACESDKKIVSFLHRNFSVNELEILKNKEKITLLNYFKYDNDFLDKLYEQGVYNSREDEFLRIRFLNRINFSELEEDFGTKMLNDAQLKLFINAFKIFDTMEFAQIEGSDGLKYKKYNGNWFNNQKYNGLNIMKFRVSSCYRCFGYRKNNTFMALRFEIDHKISDDG